MAGDADVSVRFGAELSGFDDGVKQVKRRLDDLKPPVDEFADLSARQVGSVVGLFNRLGNAAGVVLGPIGAISIELVRASQHFSEFKTAGEALGAIRETLYQAITAPLTVALGTMAAVAIVAKGLWDAFSPVVQINNYLADHKKLIGDISSAYGAMAKAALDLRLEEESLFQFKLIRDQTEGIKALGTVLYSVAGQAIPYLDVQSKALGDTLQTFMAQIAAGNADVAGFRTAIAKLGVSDPAIRDAVAGLLKLTDQAAELERQGKETAAALQLMTQIKPSEGTPFAPGGVDAIKSAATATELAAARAKLTTELNALAGPGDKTIKTYLEDLQRSIANLNSEAATLGLSTAKAAAYRKEQELIAIAKAKNITMTPEEIAQLHREAAAFGESTAHLEQLKNVQQVLGTVAQDIVGAFSAWASGTDSLTHALLLMTLQLAQAVIEAVLLDAIMTAMGLSLPTAGLPAVVGKLLFGGGRAEGGPLEMGKWYTAGEHGPEPVWGGGPGAFAASGAAGGGRDGLEEVMGRFIAMMAPHFRRLSGSSNRMSSDMGQLLRRIR